MRPWRPRLFALVLSTIGLPSLTTGQAHPACPPPGLAQLAVTRGTWVVRWLRPHRPRAVRDVGSSSYRRDDRWRCGLLEHFDGTRAGRRFEALTLIAPAGGDSLHRVWQDSEHGTVLLFTANARVQPLRFEWSRDLGDRVLRLRTTYRVQTSERFTTEIELSPNDGRTWQLVARLEYRRTGP